MLRLRLQTARTVHPRPSSWRQTTSVTPPTPSDSFAASVREIRNIRRLRSKRLRLAVLRPGQRRARVWQTPFSKTTISDSFLPSSQKVFKRTWRYWRAR